MPFFFTSWSFVIRKWTRKKTWHVVCSQIPFQKDFVEASHLLVSGRQERKLIGRNYLSQTLNTYLLWTGFPVSSALRNLYRDTMEPTRLLLWQGARRTLRVLSGRNNGGGKTLIQQTSNSIKNLYSQEEKEAFGIGWPLSSGSKLFQRTVATPLCLWIYFQSTDFYIFRSEARNDFKDKYSGALGIFFKKTIF